MEGLVVPLGRVWGVLLSAVVDADKGGAPLGDKSSMSPPGGWWGRQAEEKEQAAASEAMLSQQ